MNILYFQTAEPTFFDKESARPMRIMNLVDACEGDDLNFVVFTTDFYHQKKLHREFVGSNKMFGDKFEFRFINSPGYINHMGFARIYDHFCLGINVIRELLKLKPKPDLIIIGYPPIFTGFALFLYSKWNKIPYIVDVKDQWPDIFHRSGLQNFIKRLYIFICGFAFKQILNNASKIITISNGFKNWIADSYDIDNDKIEIVFLTRPNIIDKRSNRKSSAVTSKISLIFAGSITSVFNFDFLVGIDKIEWVTIDIFGLGPELSMLKKKFGHYPNVNFGGFISSDELSKRFLKAHGLLAPYKNLPDFNSSIPNKIFDAIDFELPILTSLGGDVKDLIEYYDIGEVFTIENSDFRLVLIRFLQKINNNKYVNGFENIRNEHLYDHDINYMKFKKIIYDCTVKK